MWIERRWLSAGIAASLLLNVFLIGIVAGHLALGQGATARSGLASGALVSRAYVRTLPAEEKRMFDATMNEHREAIRAARRQHRAARLATETDIAAPAFDRAKIAADFAALREANMAVQEAVNTALIDALAGLSPQSRAGLVEHEHPIGAKAPADRP